jgi:hypothetical protein
MGLFNLTCNKATEMVEKEKVVNLAWTEKLTLKLHLSVCKVCQSHKDNSDLMDNFFEKKNTTSNTVKITENKELKASIISKLKTDSEKK